MAKPEKKDMGYKSIIWFGMAVLVAIIINFLPLGLGPAAKTTLAVFGFTVVLWVSEILPVGLAAVIWSVLLVILLGEKVMPTKTAFGGFTNSVVWLMVGAFLLGEATVKTGLAQRIAFYVMRFGGSSYTRVLLFLWLAHAILGLLTPSGTVRVAMFIPIMAGILEAYKAEKTSNFAANLLLHVYWGSILGSTLWYTGTNMNPTAMGVLKSVTGYGPSYLTWIIWQIFPSLTLFAGCFIIIQWIMPPEKEILANASSVTMITDKLKEMGPMSGAEKRTLVFFLLAIILWMTEAFHGIDTAWVAIIVGVFMFLPGVGVLKGKALNNVSWDTILLLGVALSVTGVMKAVSLDVWITSSLLEPILGPLSAYGPAGLALGITLFVFLVHFLVASASASTAMLAPLLVKYAAANNLSAPLAAMVTARAAQNVFIFPYQTTPLVVLWGTGYMDMKKCVKCFGVICVFQIIWITALGPYWAWIMEVVK